MTLNKILKLEKSYKLRVIQMLIDEIAEDEVYNTASHFDTEQEQKRIS